MIMARNNDHLNGRIVTRTSLGLTNLVSCSSVHSILAIKKGSVAKVLNVDSHGLPKCRLKELSSIYKYEDANVMDSACVASWQNHGRKVSSSDCQVKLELTSPEEGDCPGKLNRISALDENQSMFHKSDADLEKTYCDGDELNGMTLKELKFRCRKQKVIKLDISGEAEHASSEPVELETDLEEPLIVLKQKLSKRSKPLRKRRGWSHLYSTSSVVSFQEAYEDKQSSFCNARQCSVSTGAMPSKRAPMNTAEEFHLINIKEEHSEIDSHHSQSVIAFTGCSASSSTTDHNFSDRTIAEVSEDGQGSDSETGGLTSIRNNILCYSTDKVLGSQNDKLKLGISEETMDVCCHDLSSIQETDHSSISSSEVVYIAKQEILDPCSLNEQDEVITAHCCAYDSTGKCHSSGRLLDDAVELNNLCLIEIVKPHGDISIEQLSPNHQISLHETTEMNCNVSNCFFPPLSGSSDPVSGPADYVSEASDCGKCTVGINDITLETFETEEECNDGVACCTVGICSEPGNLIDACVYNAECKGDDNSTYAMSSQNMAMDRSRADSGGTDISNDASHVEGEISVTIGNMEIVGELPIYIPGKVHFLQPREHSGSKSLSSCNSRHSNLLSHSASGLHSADACLDETEEKLMHIVEKQFCCLKSHDKSTCSNGFLPPLDVEVLEAAERQKCLSQQMLSNEGNISNQSDEILSCNDAYGFEDGVLKFSSEHPPIKLLSNRKALSPTSQEKLCQAVDAESGKISKGGNELQLGRRTNNSSPKSGDVVSELISSPEKMKISGTGRRLGFEKRVIGNSFCEASLRTSELALSSEWPNKKTKTSSIPPTTKGILKYPFPIMKPCSCIESSLFHKHTQEAITFSQRQMHDIESLSTKLVKGLKAMKGVVEEALNSESCLSKSSKCNIDKMKEAIGNASELEDTTKRWLSMMGRDCNRFCKILKSTVHKTTAPVDGLQKERKKITFADEMGGTLCRIKFFEGDPPSSVDSEQEKVDPFQQTTVQ